MASKETGKISTRASLPESSLDRGEKSEWLAGGGELGERIRSTDWSRSAFGPRDRWPEYLRVALDIVVSSRSPMCLLWGPELHMLYNDGYRDIAADKHPNAIGRPLREVWPEVWAELAPVFAAVLERGESFVFEDRPFHIRRRSVAEDTHFTFSLSPIHGEHGVVSGVLGILQETTAAVENRRRLGENEARLRSLIAAMPDLVFILSADGTHLSFHAPRDEALFVPPAAIVGRRVDELLPRDVASAYGRHIQASLEKRSQQSFEYQLQFPRGDLRHYEARMVPVDHDSVLTIVREITGQKRVEAGLRAVNEKLVELDRHRTEFLAMLSHELRNPLAPIRNSLEILDRVVPGSDMARRAQAVIDRQVGHLTQLVDELLDVTRITRGKIELRRERIDLNELARRTVEDHRGVCIANGLTLELNAAAVEVWVSGDDTRLAQAIGNLLQNAVKFTPRGGRIGVEVHADADAAQAVLVVRDTGAGIAPEMMARLFEPFAQADRTLDRSKGGLGLGLALVKGVVELHGGSVAAASQGVGEGTALTIRLPLAAPPGIHEDRLDVERREVSRRILVIEDNADSANSLREVLELGGHRVVVAHDGPVGLERARAMRPDVVLCDIGLPGMDGYAVARALRGDPELGRVTLVALTGYAGSVDVARANEAGFDAHIAKPASLEALEAALVTNGGHER